MRCHDCNANHMMINPDKTITCNQCGGHEAWTK